MGANMALALFLIYLLELLALEIKSDKVKLETITVLNPQLLERR